MVLPQAPGPGKAMERDPMGLENPRDLRQYRGIIRDVLKDLVAEAEIEESIGKGQAIGLTLDPSQPGGDGR